MHKFWQRNVGFDEWFQIEAVQEYHRVMTAESFMKDLASSVWPEGKRIGWCWLPRKTDTNEEDYCPMKEGKNLYSIKKIRPQKIDYLGFPGRPLFKH